MAITAKERYDLKKFIKELEKFRRSHTELISVYIPHDYDLTKIIQHLEQEKSTAMNIKSSTTKNNVTGALERMIQHLRLFKDVPKNGLAVFSGNVAEQEGREDFEVFSIEPPVQLNTRLYRCDKNFVLDIIIDMLEIKEVFGLVVMDRRDATIAFLKGKTIIPVVKTHSQVPGKMRAGGQSSVRFARNRELAVKDHFKKVADYMKDQFYNNQNIKGILVGGPGPTKYELVESGYILEQIKNKIIGIKDLSYTDEFGLNELVEKSQDILAKEDIIEEKKIMTKFLDLLGKKPGIVTYGLKEVEEKLALGVVDTVLLSEELGDEIIEEIEQKAKNFKTEIKIISIETSEGVQLKNLGKIAAILRYEM